MARLPLLALTLLSLAPLTLAQGKGDSGISGNWKTPGGAIVKIASCGVELCASLAQLEPNAPTRVDSNNPDPAKRDRKLCGLQIGYGFHLTDSAHADGGHLYDPKSGKTYKGVMSSTGNTLDLRGYLGIKAFGRSETWIRTSSSGTCPS